MAAPMPRVPPLTTATCPLKSKVSMFTSVPLLPHGGVDLPQQLAVGHPLPAVRLFRAPEMEVAGVVRVRGARQKSLQVIHAQVQIERVHVADVDVQLAF